jgi:hypothetical protein
MLDDNWDCYIGHTINTLTSRKRNHMNNKNCASAVMVNPIIELLEDYPCKDLTEALHREQYWMEQYPNRVNKNNAIHDAKAYAKIYWPANKEAIGKKALQTVKEKGQYTCECGVVITYNTKTQVRRHKNSKFHINYNLTHLHNNEPNV